MRAESATSLIAMRRPLPPGLEMCSVVALMVGWAGIPTLKADKDRSARVAAYKQSMPSRYNDRRHPAEEMHKVAFVRITSKFLLRSAEEGCEEPMSWDRLEEMTRRRVSPTQTLLQVVQDEAYDEVAKGRHAAAGSQLPMHQHMLVVTTAGETIDWAQIQQAASYSQPQCSGYLDAIAKFVKNH